MLQCELFRWLNVVGWPDGCSRYIRSPPAATRMTRSCSAQAHSDCASLGGSVSPKGDNLIRLWRKFIFATLFGGLVCITIFCCSLFSCGVGETRSGALFRHRVSANLQRRQYPCLGFRDWGCVSNSCVFLSEEVC